MPLSNLPEIVVSRCSNMATREIRHSGRQEKVTPILRRREKKELCELRSALCQVSRGTKIKSWRTQRATAKFQPDQDQSSMEKVYLRHLEVLDCVDEVFRSLHVCWMPILTRCQGDEVSSVLYWTQSCPTGLSESDHQDAVPC